MTYTHSGPTGPWEANACPPRGLNQRGVGTGHPVGTSRGGISGMASVLQSRMWSQVTLVLVESGFLVPVHAPYMSLWLPDTVTWDSGDI